MAVEKSDDAGSSSTSTPTPEQKKPARIRREDLLWKGLVRNDQLEKMAKEFSGEGDFIVCPGYVGPFGNSTSADKWGRLYLPGAMTGYSASRSTLLRWRKKTAEDERYSWWPEAMRKRGVEPIKASDIIKGARLTSWQKYVDVYHKASKVRVAMRTRDRQIRELAIEAKDDTNDAAGALVSLAGA